MRPLGLAIVLGVVLAGCISGPPKKSERPGDPSIYARIDATTSCALLQAEFDSAEHAFNRFIERHDTVRSAECKGYMNAAHERMRAVGCYKDNP